MAFKAGLYSALTSEIRCMGLVLFFVLYCFVFLLLTYLSLELSYMEISQMKDGRTKIEFILYSQGRRTMRLGRK